MSEAYVECMVARKRNAFMAFLKYLLIFLTAIFFFAMFLIGWCLFLAIGTAVGAYFASLYTDIEYEYLYLDKEITVDRVLNKSKRKRFAVYSLEKIEIMAPMKSWHLDEFKNRKFNVVDISSGVENQPETRYLFYYNGADKVIFEPNAEMVKILRNAAPRKVFID